VILRLHGRASPRRGNAPFLQLPSRPSASQYWVQLARVTPAVLLTFTSDEPRLLVPTSWHNARHADVSCLGAIAGLSGQAIPGEPDIGRGLQIDRDGH
jgi:hypothetical protein